MTLKEKIDIDNLKKHLDADGYYIINDFFNKDDIDNIRNSIYKKKTLEAKSGDSLRIQNYLLYDKTGIKLLNNTHLKKIIQILIGEKPILSSFAANIILPQKGEPWFHIDHPAQLTKYSFNFFNNFPMLSFQMIVAIDDLTQDNGSTIVIPGTHKNDNSEINKLSETEISQGKKFVAPSGSIMIYNPNILHSNTFNKTKNPRAILVMSFCQYFIRPQEDIFSNLKFYNTEIDDEYLLNLFGKKIPDLQLAEEFRSKKKHFKFF